MNTFGMLRGQQTRNDGCGRLALQNAERSFWQSRMVTGCNHSRPPHLVDLHQLARDVRKGRKQ